MNLAGIQHLYHHDGPFLSLHLDVSREAEGVTKGVESGWNSVRRELMGLGADESLVERVGELVRKPTGIPGPARRSVVAEGDAVLFDDVRMGDGAWPEVTTVGPLPDVSGWVAQVDGEFPFLLVVADREGADVDVYRSLSQQEHQHRSVQGQTLHINKVPGGEWAELQHSTEEVWRRNARSVAESALSAAKQYGAKLVLLAGEVRARAEVQEAIGSGGTVEVVEIESGGRAAGSSSQALWREVEIALGQQWQQRRQHVRDRLQEQSGQAHAVARGLRDVLGALVRGQVERLVVDLGAAHEQTVAPSDYPGLVLPSAAFDGQRLAADQTLLAAGAATDAEVTVLPSSSIGGDGVAALLRWGDQGS
jgi:Bacterial archaeo-eukaryotic release factor family 2